MAVVRGWATEHDMFYRAGQILRIARKRFHRKLYRGAGVITRREVFLSTLLLTPPYTLTPLWKLSEIQIHLTRG